MSNETAVVILAGGEGKRLGGGKPLKTLADERLIDRALRAAGRWSDVIAVAVREAAQAEGISVSLIRDHQEIEGPLGGLVAALHFGKARGRELVLVVPSDMPFLPSDLLKRLQSGIGDRQCAIASSDGHAHPVCGLWRTSATDRVDTYLKGGRRSLKGFAALIGSCEVEWATDPVDPFFNINRPDDIACAEQLLSR